MLLLDSNVMSIAFISADYCGRSGARAMPHADQAQDEYHASNLT
jgi:hypothetical protein